jgi:hypothetical protein
MLADPLQLPCFRFLTCVSRFIFAQVVTAAAGHYLPRAWISVDFAVQISVRDVVIGKFEGFEAFIRGFDHNRLKRYSYFKHPSMAFGSRATRLNLT